ncbi:MAG: ComEA family DNA-binding protein, partial [Tepidisphaerales bacterium]
VYNTTYSNSHRPTDVLIANKDENGVGIEGPININTAPLPVLAAIPFTKDRPTNLRIAQAIAFYRDQNDGTGTRHGPFTSLFDLYRVPDFRALSDVDMAAAHPQNAGDGMLIPGPGSNGVYGIQRDFNERYLLLNRISNMVTLRSDTFTVYVLVQGWRSAGTNHPELAAQRRAAFIVDRTNLSGGNTGNRIPKITNIPLE